MRLKRDTQNGMMMLKTFPIVAVLLLASCVPPPTSRNRFTHDDGIALEANALVDGWFDQVASGEPKDDEALSLAGWIVRHDALLLDGVDSNQLHDMTRNVRQEFASVLTSKGYSGTVVLRAVEYARKKMAAGDKSFN